MFLRFASGDVESLKIGGRGEGEGVVVLGGGGGDGNGGGEEEVKAASVDSPAAEVSRFQSKKTLTTERWGKWRERGSPG